VKAPPTIDTFLPERLRELREQAGLTQEEVAARLGMKRPSYVMLEGGTRKLSAQEMVVVAKIYGLSCEELLDPSRQPSAVLARERSASKSNPAVRISVPQKNVRKFRQVLLYILNRVGSRPNIGETVIYKLLYFIDFDHFEKHEEQLVGATYIRNHFGPTPVEFRSIVERMIKDEEIEKVRSKYFKHPQTKYLPLVEPDLRELTAPELRTIDEVLARLGEMNARQISEYSHGDVPWLSTEEGKPIEYEAVFYRTPQYSVRDYDEEE
jgi:transcriptional regulator with XRE-family HTH domain